MSSPTLSPGLSTRAQVRSPHGPKGTLKALQALQALSQERIGSVFTDSGKKDRGGRGSQWSGLGVPVSCPQALPTPTVVTCSFDVISIA
ncbi:hypothetical protein VTP01DRAFT_7991 [Rhizomucor pusillus]|uniref:uncharacterized protein n=1 Tax=Rhizomucor pusillus TaxID=4840 RepID=UPI0037448BE3